MIRIILRNHEGNRVYDKDIDRSDSEYPSLIEYEGSYYTYGGSIVEHEYTYHEAALTDLEDE